MSGIYGDLNISPNRRRTIEELENLVVNYMEAISQCKQTIELLMIGPKKAYLDKQFFDLKYRAKDILKDDNLDIGDIE